jgi:hypothetical protein
MLLISFSTPVLIRHLRQLKTVVFLRWCLIPTTFSKPRWNKLVGSDYRSYISRGALARSPTLWGVIARSSIFWEALAMKPILWGGGPERAPKGLWRSFKWAPKGAAKGLQRGSKGAPKGFQNGLQMGSKGAAKGLQRGSIRSSTSILSNACKT